VNDLFFEPIEHRYTVGEREIVSVTQILVAAGLTDLRGIPADILERAAERGRRVHEAAKLLLERRLDWATVDPAIGGYVRALDSMIRHTGLDPIPDKIEEPLYCAQYDYCGTPDALAWYFLRRRKVKVVFDWKTGMMEAVQYQLAAYAHALGVHHRAAVKLNDDGTYRMKWFPPETLRQDLQTFLQAMEETKAWVA
jgi:hypothetical protein